MVTMLGLLLAALVLVVGPAPASAANDTILVPAVATPWPGKIFVSHDAWTLSDDGFRAAPDAARFAQNLGRWFSPDGKGKFLVYSTSFGLTGKILELSFSTSPSAASLLGRTCLGSCVSVPDAYLDLTVKVDGPELVKALEKTIGRPLRDGETLALTVTGELKKEYGGAPIVGEDLVVVYRAKGR